MLDGHVPSIIYCLLATFCFCFLVFNVSSCSKSSNTEYYKAMTECVQAGGSMVARNGNNVDCVGKSHKAEGAQ